MSSDGDINAGRIKIGNPAKSAGQLQVGRRAVQNLNPGPGDAGDISIVELSHVYGEQARTEQAKFVHPVKRRHAVLPDAGLDLIGCFQQV